MERVKISTRQIPMSNKEKINPPLKPNELSRIFSLFQFPQKEYALGPFFQQILSFLNTLPSARPVLRQTQGNIFIKIEKISTPAQQQSENMIILSPHLLEESLAEKSIIFIHELSHLNDKKEIRPFIKDQIFYSDPPTPACINYNLPLTEIEIRTLSLLDEADKNALSQQLFIESKNDQALDFYKQSFKALFQKYSDIFKEWLPPADQTWTKPEILSERKSRAHFFASLENRAFYIRGFMRPETYLYQFMPPAFQAAVTSTPLGKIIDFEQINLEAIQSLTEIKNISLILDEIQARLGYQEQSIFFVLSVLKNAVLRTQNHRINPFHSSKWYTQFNELLLNPQQRRIYIPEISHGAFDPIKKAFEERYKGFLKESDFHITSHPSYCYLEDVKSPKSSLLEIGKTLYHIKQLQNHWTTQEKERFTQMNIVFKNKQKRKKSIQQLYHQQKREKTL